MSGTRPKPETLLDEPLLKRQAGRAAPPFQVLRAATENTRMMNETLREFMARKRWVLLAMGIAFVVSSAWFLTHPPLYRSSVSFYLVNPPEPAPEEPLRLSAGTDPSSLQHIATSTAMFDHLIEAFDLHAHYGIPTTHPDARAVLYAVLSSRISVEYRDTGLIIVLVKDADRQMAAAMANEIFETALSMYKENYAASIKLWLDVYAQVIDSTDHIAKARSADLSGLAAEFRSLQGMTHGNDEARDRTIDLEIALANAAERVAASNNDLLIRQRHHKNLLAMTNDPGAGIIRLKNRAMVDLATSPVSTSIKFILVVTIATAIAVSLLLLLIIENWTAPLPRRAAQQA